MCLVLDLEVDVQLFVFLVTYDFFGIWRCSAGRNCGSLLIMAASKKEFISLTMLHIFFVTCNLLQVCSLLLMVSACCAFSITPPRSPPGGGVVSVPPLEVLHVSGCEGSSKPRRETFGCRFDGTRRITIRGRGFQDSGMEILLVPSVSLAAKSKPNADTDSSGLVKTVVPCQAAHTSALLSQQILYCTLPSQDTLDFQQPSRGSKVWFDVVVRSRNSQASGVLRHALEVVGLSKLSSSSRDDDASASPDSTDTVDSEENDSLRAFKNNDWLALGIGGLEKQFKELFRRAFASRTSQVSSIATSIGVQHVRGVILHGPPGTGKTLIARTVATLLGAKNVQVINGPEIMSKFVGESEKNLRALFAAADDDAQRNGAAAGLHVLIFDEVDAVLRPRGEGDDSAARAVYDGVTTQMLAYMDGIHNRGNILIIGLTNRLDALDKALLRPGRFEVQIRIPLPDHDGRKQIFAVHTKPLKANRYLSAKVNFDTLAAETSSFSGADIAGVVRSAISFAMERFNSAADNSGGQYDTPADATTASCSSSHSDDAQLTPCYSGQAPTSSSGDLLGAPPAGAFHVVQSDFMKGISEIISAKGSTANLSPFLRNGVVPHSNQTALVLKRFLSLVKSLIASNKVRKMVVVLYGPEGSGTSAVAALAARLARVSYTQMITANSLNGLSLTEKIRRLSQVFETTAHVQSSVIVLDKLEDLLEMNFGRRPLDKITSELMSWIEKDDVATGSATVDNSKSIIFIATSKKELRDRFGSVVYDASLALAELSAASVAQLLCAYGMATTLPAAERLASVIPAGVSLKRLMFLMHMALASAAASSESIEAPSLKLNLADAEASSFSDQHQHHDLCGAPAEGSETPSPLERQFLSVLKDFGLYSPRHRLSHDGRNLFL